MASLGKLAFCRTSGKFCYLNEQHANEGARRLLREFGYLRPYRCPDCGWWHLTKRPFRPLRFINRRRPS